MENAGYVLTGWVLTVVVLGAYAAMVALRTRRALRSYRDG